jgi:hypothetical protein
MMKNISSINAEPKVRADAASINQNALDSFRILKNLRNFSLLLIILTCTSVSAKVLDCLVLRASIESNLKANGVHQYSLDVVSVEQNIEEEVGRTVGRCNNGRQKIIYARFAKPVSENKPSVQAMQSAATIGMVDTRGFIDVWMLREDVIALSSLPRGQNECSRSEGDDEDYLATLKTRMARLAYQRKHRKEEALARKAEDRCEADNLRQRKRFEQLHTAFNARWLPTLNNATKLGDPVAEIVLRLCETTPLLDRSEVAADCSGKPDDKAFARQRLEIIGFKPALHKYTPTAHAEDWHQRPTICGKRDNASSECSYRADIARYERILSVMRTGHLAVAESWNTCQIGGSTPELDILAEECQRLMNLMMAVSAGTNQFYTVGSIDGGMEGLTQMSLQRPILRGDAGIPRKEWPYDTRGMVTRNDRRKFTDPDFQRKFYAELDKTVQEIETNIADDLLKEPRWAIFLVKRMAGKMYDSLDTQNPNKPTSADIANFEKNSPRSQAVRREQEIERQKTISYLDLIASLYASRNPNLHYVWEQFPPNLQEIDQRPADVTALINAYYADKNHGVNDEIFRFNIIMILNRKRTQSFSADERKQISRCFVDALRDSSSIVRAEASWQATMVGDQINDPEIKLLIRKGRQEEQDAVLKRYGPQPK